MDWQKIINVSFKEKNWELLKGLPKNHTYQVWIALKAVSFLEIAKPEEVGHFLKFVDKNHIELRVSEENKKIILEDYLVDKQNFAALYNLAHHNHILNPEKILSKIEHSLNKISASNHQNHLVNLLDNFSKDPRVTAPQWKAFLPYLMVFSLLYGENDILDNLIEKNVKKYNPNEELIFSKPPILANPAYIYSNIICRFIENRLVRHDKTVLERLMGHLNLLSKYSSFYHVAIAADGTKLGNAFDNIERIKKSTPKDLRAAFEKLALHNFLVGKEEPNQKRTKML